MYCTYKVELNLNSSYAYLASFFSSFSGDLEEGNIVYVGKESLSINEAISPGLETTSV